MKKILSILSILTLFTLSGCFFTMTLPKSLTTKPRYTTKSITTTTVSQIEKDYLEIVEVILNGNNENSVINPLSNIEEYNGYEINVSSNNEMVNSDLSFERGESDQKVILTITITKDDNSYTNIVEITILKDDIYKVRDELFDGIDLSNINSNISFPSSISGVQLSYLSSNTNLLTNEGVINLESLDTTCELIVTFRKGELELSKTYSITVKKDALEAVSNSIFFGLDLSNITDNIDFKFDVSGVHMMYISSNPRLLSQTGTVVRGKTDENVKLTVIFSKDNNKLYKDYDLTIKGITLKERFERTNDVLEPFDVKIEEFQNFVIDHFQDSIEYKSVIVDLSSTISYFSLSDFEELLGYYDVSYENLDLKGDTENRVHNRIVKLIGSEFGIVYDYVSQSNEYIYNNANNLPLILKREYIANSINRRDKEYNNFFIETSSKGERYVYSLEELQKCLEDGYKPIFRDENTKVEYYYQKSKEILKDIILDSMSEIEKVTSIYEFVTEGILYDYDTLYKNIENNGAYKPDGFFDMGRGVCDSISSIISILCNIEGIKCVEASGYPESMATGHAWNYVYINNKWYTVCATNGQNIYNSNPIVNNILVPKTTTTLLYPLLVSRDYYDADYPVQARETLDDTIFENESSVSMIEDVYSSYIIPSTSIDLFIESEEELAKLIKYIMGLNIKGSYYINILSNKLDFIPSKFNTGINKYHLRYQDEYILMYQDITLDSKEYQISTICLKLE